MGESDTKISSHDINVNWKYQLFPKKNLKKKKKNTISKMFTIIEYHLYYFFRDRNIIFY